jgi:tetratricopeptide (TPR) repeat protein
MFDRPWLTHILTEGKALVEYCGLMVFPAGLTIDHNIRESVAFDWPAIRAFMIIAGLFAFAWYVKKKHRVLSFSILWFFINLAPLLVVRLNDYMADRWAYAASLGFALGTSAALLALYRRQRKIGMAVVLSLVLIWVTLTLIRNEVFQNPISLWADAARKAPEKSKPYTNLCGSYLERGEIRTAIKMCKTAIEKGGDDDETYINLSSAFFYNNDVKRAEEILLSRVETRKHPVYYYNLGIIYSRGKEYRKAIREYQQVLKVRPHDLAAIASIGECYGLLHNKKKADDYYRRATKEIPQSGEDYLLLAESYSRLGESGKVSECFSKALITEPLNINIRQAVANVYFGRKMYDEAYRHYSIMAKLAPDLVVAYAGMGKSMLAKGDLKEARKQFARALSLMPQEAPDRKDMLKLQKEAGG